MKIAITGASGFIGKNLKDYLNYKNYDLEILGRKKTADHKFDILKKK